MNDFPILSVKTLACDLKLWDKLITGEEIDQFEFISKDWEEDEVILIWWSSQIKPIWKIKADSYLLTYCK